MNITEFYNSIFNSFEKNEVDYMIVGGHAVNYYGYIRSTSDMDLWVAVSETNIDKLEKSFLDLGYSVDSVSTALSHLQNDHIIKIAKDNATIDLMDSFKMKHGFDECFQNHVVTEIDGVHIKVIGYDDLISIKNKSNRMKDLFDVKSLDELRKLREENQKNIQDIFTSKGLEKKDKKINKEKSSHPTLFKGKKVFSDGIKAN